MTRVNFSDIEKQLHHTFKNRSYLEEALRHSSFVNEQNNEELRDNERLEFLGDAVLNLVIGHLLMDHDPSRNEGELSRIRARLVNEKRLAHIARSIHLGSFLQLGKGEEQTSGRNKNSILADAFEALIAAVYLDGGFNTAFSVVRRHFIGLMENLTEQGIGEDYKSRLQEFVQTHYHEVPNYNVVHETGPDHDKTFCVMMSVCKITTQGEGKSKKDAEQHAARKGLDMLLKQHEAKK